MVSYNFMLSCFKPLCCNKNHWLYKKWHYKKEVLLLECFFFSFFLLISFSCFFFVSINPLVSTPSNRYHSWWKKGKWRIFLLFVRLSPNLDSGLKYIIYNSEKNTDFVGKSSQNDFNSFFLKQFSLFFLCKDEYKMVWRIKLRSHWFVLNFGLAL